MFGIDKLIWCSNHTFTLELGFYYDYNRYVKQLRIDEGKKNREEKCG
jgi:hypothetical protein